jgi:hypothetical protein
MSQDTRRISPKQKEQHATRPVRDSTGAGGRAAGRCEHGCKRCSGRLSSFSNRKDVSGIGTRGERARERVSNLTGFQRHRPVRPGRMFCCTQQKFDARGFFIIFGAQPAHHCRKYGVFAGSDFAEIAGSLSLQEGFFQRFAVGLSTHSLCCGGPGPGPGDAALLVSLVAPQGGGRLSKQRVRKGTIRFLPSIPGLSLGGCQG